MPVPVGEIYGLINQEARGEGSVIAALEAVQSRYRYLPPEALLLASERFGLPLAQVYAVATFYNAFSLKPKGKHCLQVCLGTACHVRGSPRILERLETRLGLRAGGTTRDRRFTLETVNCLGACALGPIVVADGEYSGQMTVPKAETLVKRLLRAEAEVTHD
ncbi:MAG: NAD(P)H-dependent oxidoreductase subunit E [Anaerolineales bacterium]|nr:NAD(P)H-dependent oxidoreductase subunit E [Anaerolineales bacterium]